jgi:hypothetical protein
MDLYYAAHWNASFIKIGTLLFKESNRNRTLGSNGTDTAHYGYCPLV